MVSEMAGSTPEHEQSKAKGLTTADYNRVTSFYNNRYQEQGDDVSSVGWRDKASQWLRFDMLFRDYDPRGKIILDVGCGFGDLFAFLTEKYGADFQYIGLDISSSLIEQAKVKYAAKNATFYQGELFSFKSLHSEPVDYIVESGMLSFKIENNNDYAQQIMNEMFALASEGIALNFLTDNVDYQLEKNHHFSTQDVMTWASKLSNNFVLYHDYPLWEFTAKILKNR